MLKGHPLRRRIARFAALAVCALALPLRAAVPGQVDFQGLLLDAGGQKVNGAVDLVFTLFDVPTGGGSLWTESHADVQVTDGVYGVTLGSVTPLTPELLAGGNLWLQIAVEGETLSPRRQLLAVPYAIRAESAGNATNMGGIPSGFYSEMVHHFAFDGADPPNDHPDEGTADADGDGIANFLEADNDADGLSDSVELAQGSHINLVTPVITGFTPPLTSAVAPQTITVQGSNFEAGITVAFGTDSPVATNLTPTSFEVSVVPQPVGHTSVVVTRVNGQSDTAQYAFYGRRVFLSNPTNGLIGYNYATRSAVCQTRAAELGISGVFFAWLGSDPATVFNQSGGFTRPDGTKIADDWADLTDGTLDAPIVETGDRVWTGVGPDGNATGFSCFGWQTSSPVQPGLYGISYESSGAWTQSGNDSCNSFYPVYCFEQ